MDGMVKIEGQVRDLPLVKSQDVVWEIINLFVLSSRSRLRELHLRQCFVVSR